MDPKTRKKLFVSIGIALALMIAAKLLNQAGEYGGTLRRNWGIKLPVGYSETYEATSGPSFHGDGTRYHVFSADDPDDLKDLVDWITVGELDAEEAEAFIAEVDGWLEGIQVPQDERPDYSNCGFWQTEKNDHSQLVLFFSDATELLYVVEFFI